MSYLNLFVLILQQLLYFNMNNISTKVVEIIIFFVGLSIHFFKRHISYYMYKINEPLRMRRHDTEQHCKELFPGSLQ